MTLEDLLIREEGFKPYAYQDHLGYWTIGYGKLIDERRGGGITKEEALYLLRNEINAKTAELRAAIPWIDNLDEVRRTILIAMAFQMGVDGVLGFRRTLGEVEVGNYAQAAANMRQSLWYDQTPSRAERMAIAMETGVLR